MDGNVDAVVINQEIALDNDLMLIVNIKRINPDTKFLLMQNKKNKKKKKKKKNDQIKLKCMSMVLMRLLSLMHLSSKNLIYKLLLQFQNVNY